MTIYNPFNMRDSNTLLYIVLVIVILHFVIGFGFLAYKLLGPVKKNDSIDNDNQESDSSLNDNLNK